VGGHITKCNNSSAEKTYFLFLGRALLFFKKHLLLRYPGGIRRNSIKYKKNFLKTVILEGYPSDTCSLQFLHQLMLFRQGHSQNNQPLGLRSQGSLILGMPLPCGLTLHIKHLEKFPNVFAGHLTSKNIPTRKEE